MCEQNAMQYVFGLAESTVLGTLVQISTDAVNARCEATSVGVVRDYTETLYAAQSWSCPRRVVARIEATYEGLDTRYVFVLPHVILLPGASLILLRHSFCSTHATLCIAVYGFLISEKETIPPSGASRPWRGSQSTLSSGYRPRGSAAAVTTPHTEFHRHPCVFVSRALWFSSCHAVPAAGPSVRRSMVEAAPSAAFVVAQSNFLLQFEVITLDSPAELGMIDHAFEADVDGHRGEPVVIRFGCALWPLDQQPLHLVQLFY